MPSGFLLQEKIEPPVYVSDRRLVKAIQLLQVMDAASFSCTYVCCQIQVTAATAVTLSNSHCRLPPSATAVPRSPSTTCCCSSTCCGSAPTTPTGLGTGSSPSCRQTMGPSRWEERSRGDCKRSGIFRTALCLKPVSRELGERLLSLFSVQRLLPEPPAGRLKPPRCCKQLQVMPGPPSCIFHAVHTSLCAPSGQLPNVGALQPGLPLVGELREAGRDAGRGGQPAAGARGPVPHRCSDAGRCVGGGGGGEECGSGDIDPGTLDPGTLDPGT